MNTQQLVSMLKQQLAKLEQDALIHDQNLAPSQRQSLQEIERFNSQLFAQQGAQLSPCITQLRQDIKQLEKQLYLKLGGNVIQLSCDRIQDRFSALRRALLTTHINLKSEQQRKASNRARYAKKQQQAI